MQADKERLYRDVAFLTSVAPARNYSNAGSLGKVCEYIKNALGEMGAEPLEQNWIADGKEYTNIIASYNAHLQKRLVVGAHYDVCGNQPGADDNASAVAGLLETARIIFSQKPDIGYRIDFVAYCLEEPPFFATEFMGSYIHAASLQKEKADVIGMICYEMIGYFSDEPGSQNYPFPELTKIYPSTGNYIVVVGIERFREFNDSFHSRMAKGSEVDVQVISFPQGAGSEYAGLSDQRNYWKFGYPALMINDTSFLRNPHYHQRTDTIDTLDFTRMKQVVDSSTRAILSMEG